MSPFQKKGLMTTGPVGAYTRGEAISREVELIGSLTQNIKTKEFPIGWKDEIPTRKGKEYVGLIKRPVHDEFYFTGRKNARDLERG